MTISAARRRHTVLGEVNSVLSRLLTWTRPNGRWQFVVILQVLLPWRTYTLLCVCLRTPTLSVPTHISGGFGVSRRHKVLGEIKNIDLHPFYMFYILFPLASVALLTAATSLLHIVLLSCATFCYLASFLLRPPPCQRVVCATCWWRQPRHTSSVTLVTVREVHVPWTEAGNPSCLTSCFTSGLHHFYQHLRDLHYSGLGPWSGVTPLPVAMCPTAPPCCLMWCLSVHTYPCFLRLPHFCITLVAYIAAIPCFLTFCITLVAYIAAIPCFLTLQPFCYLSYHTCVLCLSCDNYVIVLGFSTWRLSWLV